MQRCVTVGPVAACFCIGIIAPVFAAEPAVTAAATQPAAASTGAAAVKPAQACLTDIRTFTALMRKGGYWIGGSDYGYGYPVGEYGYGFGFPMGGYDGGMGEGYQNARPGYEIRSLITSATILAQHGEQRPCEDVLAVAGTVYQSYAADQNRYGGSVWARPDREQKSIAAAQPVKDEAVALGSGQLLGTDVRSPSDEALGSVYDLVLSPKTGKIAYLIVARGGLFGFDQSYVPVPWTDFKVTGDLALLVLDASKATMSAAPVAADAKFAAPGHYLQESQKVDTYWQAHLSH